MDIFHPFWTLFQKHSFQPLSALKRSRLYIRMLWNTLKKYITTTIHIIRPLLASNDRANLFDIYTMTFIVQYIC